MTRARVFMAVRLCRVCVRAFLCSLAVLVYLDAQWIAGSQGEGGDAFVAVRPHVVEVHLLHPHSRLVQYTCRTGGGGETHVNEHHIADVHSNTHTHAQT